MTHRRHIRFAPFALLAVGIVHLVPAAGAAGGDQLAALYGFAVNDANLSILMRHRAVLFGILGIVLVAAAFRPSLAPAALLAGVSSVASFVIIAWTSGGYNDAISRVIAVDVVALLVLLAASPGILSWRLEQR